MFLVHDKPFPEGKGQLLDDFKVVILLVRKKPGDDRYMCLFDEVV